jgi:hypothetical protein
MSSNVQLCHFVQHHCIEKVMSETKHGKYKNRVSKDINCVCIYQFFINLFVNYYATVNVASITLVHVLLSFTNLSLSLLLCFIIAECNQSTFGAEYKNRCHCLNKARCNKVNGHCPRGDCDSGWKPGTCSESKIKVFLVLY